MEKQHEKGLATIKLFAILSFLLLGILLMAGVFSRRPAVGLGNLMREPLMPGGIKSIAGSMLIVMSSYSGFEIIGLAASETDNPRETVPKAIRYTPSFVWLDSIS